MHRKLGVRAWRLHHWKDREDDMTHNKTQSNQGTSAIFMAVMAAVAMLAAGPASAHITQDTAGGFSHGFLHPLSGADHFLAMFAVGIWGAQMGGRAVWALPVTFPLIMAMGGLAGIMQVPFGGIETGIAMSMAVLGAAIAAAWRPNDTIALAVVSVFAVFHGYAHGAELPIATDPADYAVGFVIATGMIHVLGVGVGLALKKPFAGRLARALGGGIVAGGAYFLLLA
jgi:urease accessory protein